MSMERWWNGNDRRKAKLGLIHNIRHVSFPSPFHLRSVRLVCFHTVRRILSSSITARDWRPAIISIKYATSLIF